MLRTIVAWRQRLALSKETEAAFNDLLAGLGVGPLAVQESPPSSDRVLLAVELSVPERLCWDELSGRLGVSTRSAGKLARAVLRSFIAHPWNVPIAVDLGPIEDTNEWPTERQAPSVVFSVLLSRVAEEEVATIIESQLGRLSSSQLEGLQAAISLELQRRQQ